MAIRKLDQATLIPTDGITIQIDNGDLIVLREIIEAWGFKDEASALRFALAILIKSDDQRIRILTNGSETTLSPAEELLRDQPPQENATP